MRRLACLFLMFLCGAVLATAPRAPVCRLDYTGLADRWGHVLDGYGYLHDALSLRTNITRHLGLATNSVAVGYDSLGQIVSWSAKEADGTLRLNEQFSFGYDPGHNLNSRTNGALAQTFNNDPLNQLTNITRSGALTVSGATPVPATNVTVNGQLAQTYADFTFASTNNALTNGLNSFTNIALNLYGLGATNVLNINLPASVALQYDLNGNLTNDGTRSFAYDAENKLVTNWVNGAWKSEFVYDGLGRRRIERDYAWQTGAWVRTNETYYLYDGFLVLQERDSNNVPRATYTRGLDLSGTLQYAGGIGGLLALTQPSTNSPQHFYYHADGAGNVTALMDGSETMAARYLYGPFGRLTAQWGPRASANAMQFSSMPRHANSGLSLYPFRAYDPSLQRWTSRDLIGEVGGINLYGFVGNSPIGSVDPLGLSWLSNLYQAGHDYLYQAGQGIYDWMMGDRVGNYNPYAKGAMDAQYGVVDIDRNNNVLRDSIGEGLAVAGDMGREAALNYLGGKALEAGLGMGARILCKAKPLLNALKPPKGLPKGPGINLARDAAGSAPEVAWNNGWRTPDGKFGSPLDGGRAGAEAEKAVWDAIREKAGWNVIEGRVSVRNAAGDLRVYDGAAVSPRGRVIGLEVKSGSGTRTGAQAAFDAGVNTFNPAVGVGQSANIPAPVQRAILIGVP